MKGKSVKCSIDWATCLDQKALIFINLLLCRSHTWKYSLKHYKTVKDEKYDINIFYVLRHRILENNIDMTCALHVDGTCLENKAFWLVDDIIYIGNISMQSVSCQKYIQLKQPGHSLLLIDEN